MNSHYDQTRVELDDARFLHIVEGAGTTVTCLQGCLWLTRDGCARDFALAPGACYEVEDGTPVIVSAFGPSVAHVTRPAEPHTAPTAFLSRLARWWPRGRRTAAA
jgi:hypothetical protein